MSDGGSGGVRLASARRYPQNMVSLRAFALATTWFDGKR
jgi:hypothetical protein